MRQNAWRSLQGTDNSTADYGRMRYRDRVSQIALLLEPATDSGDHLQDGFASVRSGSWVSQPRGHMLGLVQLDFAKIGAAPLSVIAVAQIQRDGC